MDGKVQEVIAKDDRRIKNKEEIDSSKTDNGIVSSDIPR